MREIAQIGAVIGREFSYQLLDAVAPVHDKVLADALDQLSKAELIFPRAGLPKRPTSSSMRSCRMLPIEASCAQRVDSSMAGLLKRSRS